MRGLFVRIHFIFVFVQTYCCKEWYVSSRVMGCGGDFFAFCLRGWRELTHV